MARIGVNALYLIPGGVGGTEIYLARVAGGAGGFDQTNQYFVFTNLETGADLVPQAGEFPLEAAGGSRAIPAGRILWEQIVLPLEASRYHLDVMFNPGFTAPLLALCRSVTTFHDLQHKRHPGILPLVRFAVLAIAAVGGGASVAAS